MRNKFIEKYPQLFGYNDGRPMFGFCCGDGWEKILDETFFKLKDAGIRITNIKEKFGGLRIYTDYGFEHRIELFGKNSIVGIKDNKIIEKEVPGADVAIEFVDHADRDHAGGMPVRYYLPEKDEFIGFDLCKIEVKSKEYIKGRLASITGLVDAEPIEEEPISKIIEHAENKSYEVCEFCGSEENVTVEGGWIKTLCAGCRKKWMNQESNIRQYFRTLRFSEHHHLGLGDIRLTMSQQEEVIRKFEELEDQIKNEKEKSIASEY